MARAEASGAVGRCPVDISDPALTAGPYGGFARIREEAPVVRGRGADGRVVWIVTRHDEVMTVLTDPGFVNNSRSVPGTTADLHAESLIRFGLPEAVVPYLAEAVTQLDPPHHTRLRKLVARAFSARRVAELAPRVRELTGELVDALPGTAGADGSVDLIEHFAYPLPITIICELIGVPAEDRAMWRKWSSDYSSLFALGGMLAESSAYLRELAERRRAEPGDDLLTGLLQVHDEESGRLSETELVTMVITLMIAGHETTAHLIGNSVLALLTHPGQLALLRQDPELLPGAVQELLRWCSPVVFGKQRYATRDVEVGGTLIGAGDVVLPVLGAANHDPRRFPDPERLDITRRPDGRGVAHVAYSRGPHYCLGATLANQEAEVALSALFGRYPGMRLAVPEEALTWNPVPSTRQLARLPVRLGGGPAASA
ncbi:cytochrome P450 [Streptomyces sparsogenes]|uniref:cytochrome P450 family protein n=1 Tax=Streptomyces sparsogenes TaxID=67365 RepID=UPI00384FA988